MTSAAHLVTRKTTKRTNAAYWTATNRDRMSEKVRSAVA